MTDTGRRCGECSLCCTVLRVDELRKLGGTPCAHLAGADSGCGIYTTRPAICRAYRCAWLRGAFRADDRPDHLGAVLDFQTQGMTTRLSIREATPGAFDRSPRLREIAEEYRTQMPVRITDVDDVLNRDRPYRVLLPSGEEQRIAGDVVTFFRDGEETTSHRIPWLERWVRRASATLLAVKLRWIGSS